MESVAIEALILDVLNDLEILSRLRGTQLASARTSSATTAKPRPASPARAASMAAFNANKLVWVAESSMVLTIEPTSRQIDGLSFQSYWRCP